MELASNSRSNCNDIVTKFSHANEVSAMADHWPSVYSIARGSECCMADRTEQLFPQRKPLCNWMMQERAVLDMCQ